jgi:hypothetical protein
MEISQKEIQVLENQVSPLVKQADSYVIDSVEAVDVASTFLKKLRETETSIEAKRLEFTAPLNQSLKAINDTFKSLKQPLEEARMLLTNRILNWKRIETERLAKEEERRRKIQEAHLEAGHQVNAPVVLERPENKIGNTQTRKVWTFRVKEFSKIPDVYKVINQVAVNQSIRDGVRDIPGIDIYQEEQLSIVGR